MKNYNSPHAVSFTSQMRYNRGYAYALLSFLNSSCGYALHPHQLLLKLVNLLRFSIHGQLPLVFVLSRISCKTSRTFFVLLFPVALFLVAFDRLRGIVVLTHKEFLAHMAAEINVISSYY